MHKDCKKTIIIYNRLLKGSRIAEDHILLNRLTKCRMPTFVHISDLHFGRTSPHLLESLHQSLADIRPDLVVISGDLTQRARTREFIAARSFLDSLQWPFLVIPGNHDIPAYNLAERVFNPWRQWNRHLRHPLEPVIDNSEYIAVGINTARRFSSFTDWSRGRIKEEQWTGAADILQRQPADKLRVLVIHHPFWLPEKYLHRHIIGGRDEALPVFKKAGADIILGGHVHITYAHTLEGIIISHSGTALSNRLMTDIPNSFTIVNGNRRQLTIETREWKLGDFRAAGSRQFTRGPRGWSARHANHSVHAVSHERVHIKVPATIPLYCNPESGSWEKMVAAIKNDSRMELHPLAPAEMVEKISQAVAKRAKRIVVSGGDGTIALAARRLAGTATELAIIPSGTLNHFARRTGIPIQAEEALEIALTGIAHPVDVGYVNDVLFINTSSVGAYPTFVRSREYLENRMHYLPASIIAGVRRFVRFRLIRLKLEGKMLRTPLVFVGVGERELRFPAIGQVKKGGQAGLHLLAVECNSRFEVIMLVIKSVFGGIDPMTKEMVLQNQLVDSIEMNFHHRRNKVHVALDGELNWLQTPLTYRLAPGEIMVAMPEKHAAELRPPLSPMRSGVFIPAI